MKKFYNIIFFCVCLILIVIGIISHRRTMAVMPHIEPENFDQCALIYPVIATDPPACDTPSGLHFIKNNIVATTTATTSATTTATTTPDIDKNL